jgi:hypothetical protein
MKKENKQAGRNQKKQNLTESVMVRQRKRICHQIKQEKRRKEKGE